MPEYTAHASTTAGRNGHVESSDGVLKHDLTLPKESAARARPVRPTRSSCSPPATPPASAARSARWPAAEKVKVGEITVKADVTLHIDPGPDFYISVKLAAKIDGVDHDTAEKLVHKAHEVCPYSKATRNNVKVELSVL